MADQSKPGEVLNITSEDQFNAHIESLPNSAVVAIYFHTTWAAPCEQTTAIFNALASSYPHEPTKLSFLSLDAEDLYQVSEIYDVTAVPYMVILRAGSILETVSGADAQKWRNAVEKFAREALGLVHSLKDTLPPPQKVTPRVWTQPAQISEPVHGNGTGEDAASKASTNGVAESSTGADSEDLNTRLAKLVKAAPVMLFMKGTPGTPQCGFSRQLVGILRERSVRFGFFNILADDEVRQGLKKFSDWPTYPQLYVDGELVGGLDIVKEEIENNPEFLKASA